MKKEILPTLLLLIFSTNAFAEKVDSALYIGVGGFSGSGELEQKINSNITITQDHDTSGNDFKVGYIFPNNVRLEVSFTSIDLEYDSGYKEELSGIDFDMALAFGSKKIMPFIGAGLGFYTYEDTAQYFTDNEDLRGVSFNLSGGLFFEVASAVEIETSLKMKNITWQDVVYTNGDTLESTTSMLNMYLGAKIKF